MTDKTQEFYYKLNLELETKFLSLNQKKRHEIKSSKDDKHFSGI